MDNDYIDPLDLRKAPVEESRDNSCPMCSEDMMEVYSGDLLADMCVKCRVVLPSKRKLKSGE